MFSDSDLDDGCRDASWQFVTEAVEEKLKDGRGTEPKPWMRAAGGLRHLRHETARINKLIAEEFEKIEPEDRS